MKSILSLQTNITSTFLIEKYFFFFFILLIHGKNMKVIIHELKKAINILSFHSFFDCYLCIIGVWFLMKLCNHACIGKIILIFYKKINSFWECLLIKVPWAGSNNLRNILGKGISLQVVSYQKSTGWVSIDFRSISWK